MTDTLTRQDVANRLHAFQSTLKWNLQFLFMTEAQVVGQHIVDTGPQRMPTPLFSIHPMARDAGDHIINFYESVDWVSEEQQTTAGYYQGETRGGDVDLSYQPLAHVPESAIKDGHSIQALIGTLSQNKDWTYARTAHEHLISMRDQARSELLSSFPNGTKKEAIQYLNAEIGDLADIAEYLNTNETYVHQIIRRPDNAKVSEKTRNQVLERDNHECTVCSAAEDLHVHHIRPAAKGGSGNKHNLAVVCASCHAEIHRNNVDTEQEFSDFRTQ